jgi:alginate O-acetyltransferase complex protein AlgI
MLFNSLPFLLFLLVAFTLHWLLPFKYRWVLLLIASYFFYLYNNPWYGLLLAGTTLVDYYIAIKIFDANDIAGKKKWLLVSVISNIGCLVAFKYSAMFYNTGVVLSNELASTSYRFMSDILIPAGLSFYTFQSLSYTMDVYRNNVIPERNPFRFALYVSFFPQLVAGPVERFGNLMPQFYKERKLQIDALASGVRLAIWGFFKKMVIADRVAQFIDPVFADAAHYSAATFLISGFFFAVQVYCDFSGYTDIATGVARMFGYELSLNWRRPLLATSLHSFWKRHHITMTCWFRDYLYVSLGGNRVAIPRWLLNVFLVFLISGLWHGASWTFVIWGASHGLLYVIEIIIARNWPGIKKLKPLGWFYFIGFYVVSLLAFRADGIQQLMLIYKKVFSFDYDFTLAFRELKTAGDLFPLLLAITFCAFIFMKDLAEENSLALRYPKIFNTLRPVYYILIFIGIFVFGVFNANEFIYFQF